jgi:hypothetical protein
MSGTNVPVSGSKTGITITRPSVRSDAGGCRIERCQAHRAGRTNCTGRPVQSLASRPGVGNELFFSGNDRSTPAVEWADARNSCAIVRSMFRGRRKLAGFLALLFSAVEIFASAPQLHFHAQAGTQAAIQQRGQALTTQSSGRNATPNDCLACRTFSVATTLISWLGVTPPSAHQTLTLVAPTLFRASEFLDDARGRAPPAR